MELLDMPAASPLRTSQATFHTEALLSEQIDHSRDAFQQFLDRAAAAISGYLSCHAEITDVGVEQMPLSEALGNIESGSCAAPLDLSPCRGTAYLALGKRVVGALLDNLLGASADAAEIPRESLTSVDLHVLQEIIALLASEVRAAWEPICDCSFSPLSAAAAEACTEAGDDAHSVLVLRAEVTLNGVASPLQLIVPSLLIRLAFAHRRATSAPEPATRDALLEAVYSASFGVEAVLRGSRIKLRDLLSLRVGHTLALPHKTDELIQCQVNGVVKYRGELLTNGESTGFQVVSEASA
jgi:flagellar motor switch protein FliM